MAGRIPQTFINDLLARIDIVEVIDARLTLKKSGSDYSGLCPFHDEKTPSFNVVPDKQFYYCFGCQASGTALTFLMEHDRLDFVTAVETLAQMAGVPVPREAGGASAAERDEHAALYGVMEQADGYFRRMLRAGDASAHAAEYLKGRGIAGLAARDFGIGYAPSGWSNLIDALGVPADQLVAAGLAARNEQGRTYDRFRDRIMFPIRDTRGRVIGFGGRVLGDEQPKYMNSPETAIFHKGRELYGVYEARQAVRHLDRLLVVEGYMDVVALAQAGIANVVATLGTATTAAHLEKLFRYADVVVCCFDGDEAGRRAAWKALETALPLLSRGRQLEFMFLPDGEDPDSLVRRAGKADFQQRLDGAVPTAEYLFQRLGHGLDLRTMDGRAHLAELALTHIRRAPDGMLRELMLGRLAEHARIPLDALRQSARVAGDATPAHRRPPPRANRARSRLGERLLAMLIQHPRLVRALSADQRQRLEAVEGSRIADIVRFITGQEGEREADTASILGFLAADPHLERIAELGERQLMLEEAALEPEFAGGIDQYLEQADKARRREAVEALREDGSSENFRRYWQLLRGSN